MRHNISLHFAALADCKKRSIVALSAASLMAISPASRAGTTLLSDGFNGPSVNPHLWHIPKWCAACGTFVGRTQFRVSQSSPLPPIYYGTVILNQQTYNPTGFSFYAYELISNQQFPRGTGLDIVFHSTMTTPLNCGVVTGLFLYALKPGSNTYHDEIDFELVTNYPKQVETNIYADEMLGVGNPALVNLPSGSVSTWHIYEIRWTPTMVSWLVDGTVVRSTTQNIPTGPMNVYMNTWAPTEQGWQQAYCAAVQPTSSPAENKVVDNLVTDYVTVTTLP